MGNVPYSLPCPSPLTVQLDAGTEFPLHVRARTHRRPHAGLEVLIPAFLLVLALSHIQPALAAQDCFAEHLREAISLNELRRPLYAAATGGESDSVSRELIALERASLIFAKKLDERARPYQDAGIGLLCDEFVSMTLTPTFRLGDASTAPFRPRPLRLFHRTTRALRRGGYAALSGQLETELHDIPEGSACLTRHLLESTLRAANLAPGHAAGASNLGMESPDGLSRAFIFAQLASLPEAARLDRKAESLHAQGVPILCNDVPPIPPR